jgi:hypothetical protein
MKNYFPDYEGGADYAAACDYILNRFVSLNQAEQKQIYTHFTCATDTTQIRFVMAAVNGVFCRSHFLFDLVFSTLPNEYVLTRILDIIIQENLRMCGLI